jgi:hypothetical protein
MEAVQAVCGLMYLDAEANRLIRMWSAPGVCLIRRACQRILRGPASVCHWPAGQAPTVPGATRD